MEMTHLAPLLSPLVTLAILGGLKLLANSFERKLKEENLKTLNELETIKAEQKTLNESVKSLHRAQLDLSREQVQQSRELVYLKGKLDLPINSGREEP